MILIGIVVIGAAAVEELFLVGFHGWIMSEVLNMEGLSNVRSEVKMELVYVLFSTV